MKIVGTVHLIMDLQRVSERFSKRELVLETRDNPRYPQVVVFQCTGDRIASLDRVSRGDEVEIEFELRGREWRSPKGEMKYFNTLDVSSIRVVRSTAGEPPGRDHRGDPVPPDEDIPF